MMTTQLEEPMDERVHCKPEIIKWWMDSGGQAMDENMIHRYLEDSVFFDATTKNGLFFTQAGTAFDEGPRQFVANRHLFENALRHQLGTEYMIVEEPKPAPDAVEGVPPPGTTGIWVVRKQDRQKVEQYDGREVEELTTLETYYTVGQNMFKAASMADTIGNRLLGAQRHLQKFVDQANALPSFDPAAGGHYYLRPSNKPAATGTASSTPGTPSRSREGSVAPVADAHSVRSGSVDLSAQAGSGGDPSFSAREDRLLQESLGMSVQFSDEYADENPIIGEPGKFSFTSSTAAVKKRKADEEAARAKVKAEKEAKASPFAKMEKAPAPPSIMTEAKAGKTEKEKKVRRKKSKGNALSPTTPGAGPSALS